MTLVENMFYEGNCEFVVMVDSPIQFWLNPSPWCVCFLLSYIYEENSKKNYKIFNCVDFIIETSLGFHAISGSRHVIKVSVHRYYYSPVRIHLNHVRKISASRTNLLQLRSYKGTLNYIIQIWKFSTEDYDDSSWYLRLI